mmetsp:Transcript_81349/g.243939  ORF Transcript_81349/g.243939 Transcript_81349/m.243939 type:complete len:278 (+) Transcript_81349:284-1117(+)
MPDGSLFVSEIGASVRSVLGQLRVLLLRVRRRRELEDVEPLGPLGRDRAVLPGLDLLGHQQRDPSEHVGVRLLLLLSVRGLRRFQLEEAPVVQAGAVGQFHDRVVVGEDPVVLSALEADRGHAEIRVLHLRRILHVIHALLHLRVGLPFLVALALHAMRAQRVREEALCLTGQAHFVDLVHRVEAIDEIFAVTWRSNGAVDGDVELGRDDREQLSSSHPGAIHRRGGSGRPSADRPRSSARRHSATRRRPLRRTSRPSCPPWTASVRCRSARSGSRG